MIRTDHGTRWLHLPGPLRLPPAYAFAGRARELATLRALLPRAVGEGRRAALVAGEPGSGKSRLVRELAAELAEEGTTVLYGDCDAVVGSPYAPFATALDRPRPGGRRHAVRPRRPRRLDGRARTARPGARHASRRARRDGRPPTRTPSGYASTRR